MPNVAGRIFSLNNTQRALLQLLQITPASARLLAAVMYPESKQLDKKTATYTRHLRAMERMALVQHVGELWFPRGRYAIDSRPPPKRAA